MRREIAADENGLRAMGQNGREVGQRPQGDEPERRPEIHAIDPVRNVPRLDTPQVGTRVPAQLTEDAVVPIRHRLAGVPGDARDGRHGQAAPQQGGDGEGVVHVS